MKSYLSDIKSFIGRGAKLNSEVTDFLTNKYNSENPKKFNVVISRYVKDGLLFCSKPLTFGNGEYAISSGRKHDYSKYLPLIRQKLPGLSIVINILKNGCGYISLFNLKKILVIDTNNNDQFEKVKEILIKTLGNISFDNKYCYIKKPTDNDKQNLYEKNRDRILYLILNKHESENIIFGHSVYYKTLKYDNISAAYLVFDAYSKSSVFQEGRNMRTYLVYDFAIEGEYSISEAHSFVERCKKLSKRMKCKVVPISIFETADKKTISYLKENGIVFMNFDSIFGKNSKNILNKMSSIDKSEYEFDNFDYVLRVVNEYEQFDSIKGGLFEHLCAAILKKLRNNFKTKIDCNFHLKGNDNNVDIAQFDIVVETYDGLTMICECKSYSTKMLYGEKHKNSTYAYFLNQVNKYKELNPNKLVRSVVFSANGFQKSIIDECAGKVISDSQEYINLPIVCDYEKLKQFSTSISEYLLLWKNYYLKN